MDKTCYSGVTDEACFSTVRVVRPERTYQIVGGGLVIDEIMRALDVEEIEICPWALREGAILRWLDQFGRTRLGF